jgi:anaerobic magnesium-protoporphyrin IX monomethyl ester cyclase
MMTPKVLLIVPPTGLYIREDRCQTPIEDLKTVSLRPPIDLMYAAAEFEQTGCECRIVDYPGERLGWKELESDLRSFMPDFLVLSITTPSLEHDLRAAEVAKHVEPNIVTIAKGAHFNVLDVSTLEQRPALDMVLRGEYEEACRELGARKPLEEILGLTYRNSRGEIERNPARPFIDDLNTLPFPARHLTRNELYVRPDTGEPQTTIVTNRGCPFDCVFCLATQVAGRKNRVRSVGNIIAEIEECVDRHKIRNFLFRSDLFTTDKAWVIELCQEILNRRLDIEWVCNSRVDTIDEEMLAWMKKAHCWLIAYGVETGSHELLEKMNKRATLEDAHRAMELTRQAGIQSSIYLLFGLPWDTPATLQEDIEFAKQLDPDFLEIFYVYPFPGTPLYDMAVRDGLLRPGEIPTAAYSQPAMPTSTMNLDELRKWRRIAMRQFYLRPKVIGRTLLRARSPKVLLNYLKYGWIQLKDLIQKH